MYIYLIYKISKTTNKFCIESFSDNEYEVTLA